MNRTNIRAYEVNKYKPKEELLIDINAMDALSIKPPLRDAMAKIYKRMKGRVMFYQNGESRVGIRVPESPYLHAFLRVAENNPGETVYAVISFRISNQKAPDYDLFGYDNDSYNMRYSSNLSRVLSMLYKIQPLMLPELVGGSVRLTHATGEDKMRKHDKALSEVAYKFMQKIVPVYRESEKQADLIKFISTMVESADMGVTPTLYESSPIVSAFREFVDKQREASETISYLGKRVCVHVISMAERLYLAVSQERIIHFVEVPRIESLPQVVQSHIHTVNTIDNHDCDAGYVETVVAPSGRSESFAQDHYILFINEGEISDVVDQVINRGTKYEY